MRALRQGLSAACLLPIAESQVIEALPTVRSGCEERLPRTKLCGSVPLCGWRVPSSFLYPARDRCEFLANGGTDQGTHDNNVAARELENIHQRNEDTLEELHSMADDAQVGTKPCRCRTRPVPLSLVAVAIERRPSAPDRSARPRAGPQAAQSLEHGSSPQRSAPASASDGGCGRPQQFSHRSAPSWPGPAPQSALASPRVNGQSLVPVFWPGRSPRSSWLISWS